MPVTQITPIKPFSSASSSSGSSTVCRVPLVEKACRRSMRLLPLGNWSRTSCRVQGLNLQLRSRPWPQASAHSALAPAALETSWPYPQHPPYASAANLAGKGLGFRSSPSALHTCRFGKDLGFGSRSIPWLGPSSTDLQLWEELLLVFGLQVGQHAADLGGKRLQQRSTKHKGPSSA